MTVPDASVFAPWHRAPNRPLQAGNCPKDMKPPGARSCDDTSTPAEAAPNLFFCVIACQHMTQRPARDQRCGVNKTSSLSRGACCYFFTEHRDGNRVFGRSRHRLAHYLQNFNINPDPSLHVVYLNFIEFLVDTSRASKAQRRATRCTGALKT